MGRVVSFEMSSQNPEKANEFYTNVFGWEIFEPNWGYWPVKTSKEEEPGGIDGGISKGPADYPHGTRLILEVDSIDDALEKAKENGAQIIREKMDFDNFYLAYIVDPVGICLGLKQNK
ncbi:VOC family protein [Paenibacillus solani]|uniref:VOC family protein n=1 Tax=Paenibacillus solani TaxID=1705565 RepID=UPI003D2B8DDE